jgi:hypothetical protein
MQTQPNRGENKEGILFYPGTRNILKKQLKIIITSLGFPVVILYFEMKYEPEAARFTRKIFYVMQSVLSRTVVILMPRVLFFNSLPNLWFQFYNPFSSKFFQLRLSPTTRPECRPPIALI